MIHYHGGPITPDSCALKVWKNGHAFISFANLQQIGLVAQESSSFALDNGAFTFWKQGKAINWQDYYSFVKTLINHPKLDFAVIPDVIDGTIEENDKLIAEWPFGDIGAPVWHTNEPIWRFWNLCCRFKRVCIGSSGEYDVKYVDQFITRAREAFKAIATTDGYPMAKIHGLRMLNPLIFTKLPLSSADSTNIARNIGIDRNWQRGSYMPKSKEMRAMIMRERIEWFNAPEKLP